MGHLWYYQIDGRELGPIDSRTLRALAETAKLRPTDLVRRELTEGWLPASKVRGLFAAADRKNGRWLFRDGDRELGPFSDKEIVLAARQGKLSPEHELRLVDQPKWRKAATIPKLFDQAAIPAPAIESESQRFRFQCPGCRRTLKCTAKHFGQTVTCPSCKAAILVPSPGGSASSTTAPQQPDVIALAPVADQGLVARDAQPSTPEVIRSAARVGASAVRGVVGWLTAPSAPDFRPPRDSVCFYSSGMSVDLGRGILESPLVYATGQRFRYVQEASLVELPLPVGGSDTAPLGYWPAYHDCSAAQRARYLEWLYTGRRDPTIDIGYVFIYFYGLERRVLVDGQDHELVAEELLRLLSIYTSSRSFSTYAISLLWLTIYLGSLSGTMPDDLAQRAVALGRHRSDQALEYCLAYFVRSAHPIPVELAWSLAENDERSPVTVVVRRQPEKLRELFTVRFQQRFPAGLRLEARKREQKLFYRPASSTLLNCHNQPPELANKWFPDVAALRGQFVPLVRLWTECVEELREFDKASRDSRDGKLSSEAYEALPPELRADEHPEQDAWQLLIERSTDESGWPIVSASALASIKGIPVRARLTKRQCELILSTADSLGMALEPDTRLTGKSYEWDESVVLYHAASAATAKELADYRAASVLLRLGYVIADADGQVDEVELTHVADHLERQFDLSPALSKRLDAQRHLLKSHGCDDSSLGRSLQKSLSLDDRRLVGKFLVGVAAADKLVSPEERSSLRKVYKSLGVPADELDDLLSRFDEAPVVSVADIADADSEVVENEPPPALNYELIAATRKETERVRELLSAVFDGAEGESTAVASEAEVEPTVDIGGPSVAVAVTPQGVSLPITDALGSSALPEQINMLPGQYRTFLQTVVTRSTWPRAELMSIARDQRLMFEAALSAINEWSCDIYEDLLIEDDTVEVIVHRQLLEST